MPFSSQTALLMTLICVLPTEAQDINVDCTNDGDCTIPGQTCELNPVYNKRVCGCAGSEFRGGASCSKMCPPVDKSRLFPPTCFAGTGQQCVVPCNFPEGECRYETGLCFCKNGYLPPNCTYFCPGRFNPCNGHGRCTINAQSIPSCECDVGYVGSSCNTLCPGPVGSPCYGNGRCLDDGTCSCSGGWKGEDCSIECPQVNGATCSGHGVCSDEATCECDWGFTGSACEYECPYFHGKPCGCSNIVDPDCRGQCIGQGECECNPGFGGPDCGLMCLKGFGENEGLICSGHGSCGQDGQCQCVNGYSGASCSMLCPGSRGLTCSGHGICTPTDWDEAGCVCDSNLDGLIKAYEGAECEIAIFNEETRLEDVVEESSVLGSPWPLFIVPLPFAGLVALIHYMRKHAIKRREELEAMEEELVENFSHTSSHRSRHFSHGHHKRRSSHVSRSRSPSHRSHRPSSPGARSHRSTGDHSPLRGRSELSEEAQDSPRPRRFHRNSSPKGRGSGILSEDRPESESQNQTVSSH